MSMRPHTRARRGLSFVEFVGCVFAITGGVAIGSMYLGVDVEEAAVDVLEYVELVPRPAEGDGKSLQGNQSPQGNGAAPTTPQSLAASNATEPAEDLRGLPFGGAPAVEITPEQRHELTKTYWDGLNACMKAEAEHRAVQPEGGLYLHDYLARRHDGHQKAADDIGELELWGVDGHVAAYAKRVRDWHESGAEMFLHARDLVTDAPTAQLSGPFAQQWQSSVTQHQMEERLLAEKHAAVQSYLDHANRSAADTATE
jgi:hypothetical protein